MASLADVFTESERTNWLKAWLAIDIAKSGIEQFVETEAKSLHRNIYNAILTNGTVACIGCNTANLLKCPSPGICNKRGANSLCSSMHDTAFKQPRPCPANVCNKVLVEIAKQHTFSNPSWKNTLADKWSSSHWQIAKAYLPPDGYTEKNSIQDTDFNGVISFMMNCKHFDNLFSFPKAPGKTHSPCLLTKAREIVRTVRHSSTCKVTDTDLQDIFITLTGLLTDPKCLAHDLTSREAVRKLAKLQTDVLKLTTEDIVDLLEASQDKLEKSEQITETAIDEIRIYIENCRKDLSAHTHTFKQQLSDHTGKCKHELDEHCRKSRESNYEQSCKDFRRRLRAHYINTLSNMPLSILDQSLDKPITDIYATPKLHRIEIKKDGTRVKMEQALTYKHIFYTDDYSNRRIYLQGEPGSGKSMFSAKLVYDWCHGNQVSTRNKNTAFDDVFTIQRFNFLFYISLRDSRDETDVTQMIKKQLINTTFSEDEREYVYKLFVQIIRTEICLVVREGLDEWVSPYESNLAEPYMAGFQNDTCTILTTSRPWKLADERIKNSQIDILFEIEGISDPSEFNENILRCVIEQTRDLEEISIQFEAFINHCKLQSLSSSPMLYTLVICTWVNATEEEMGHLNGSSLCKLYTTLFESLCKKAHSTIGYFNKSNPPPVHCFSSTAYLQPIIEHLNKLAEVACKLLFSLERDTSIVFNEITLSNFFSLDEFEVHKTFALKSGILTNRKNKSRSVSSYSFLHKTLQEFLSAYYIACNPNVINDVIFSYLKSNANFCLEVSQVFIFLCGMNISAANELSALMCVHNGVSIAFRLYFVDFQRIIESGIREAAANNQKDIQLRLRKVYINESNIRNLKYLWSTNTFNAQVLYAKIDTSYFLSSTAHGEPTSHFELCLSACHNLKSLYLLGGGIWLRDTICSATSDLPVWIVLNSKDPVKSVDPPLVLPSIKYINLKSVTCSASCLRSLFSTLLTLDHDVKCDLEDCKITSSAEVSDRCTKASILTLINNEVNMRSLENDCPGLWEALCGLIIKSLSLSDGSGYLRVNHTELFTQFLSSLTQLETLSIEGNDDLPSMCEGFRGLNIKSLSLRPFLIYSCGGLIVNQEELLSHSLSSLTQLETLSISVPINCPSLFEALRGLNIKSLSLIYDHGLLQVNHIDLLTQSLKSLTQLENLSFSGNNSDCIVLLTALHGLNLKRLNLCGKYGGLLMHNGRLTHFLSRCLSSLTHMETLSFSSFVVNSSLLEALRGLNIKSLSLSNEWSNSIENHAEPGLKPLSSITQLETLIISVSVDRYGLWEAIHGLNIKNLRLFDDWRGMTLEHVESLSESLSSLTQLEMFSIYVNEHIDIQLPPSLKYLNIYCYALDPSEFRDLLNTITACTQQVEIRLEFGCFFPFHSKHTPMEEYNNVQQKVKTLKNVIVKRFIIYIRRPGRNKWSVRYVDVSDEDYHDDYSGDNEEYLYLLCNMDDGMINRVSMRLQIIPESIS
ncbi:uncharacterized protein LOC127843245 [Dreissena polymorpha]|uniref:NACHT domain-containing protein n=1 Tax=Dreissena polymorpha TaxID=45954 RepID=A0A9D4IUM5_DREPO|nr:uncharacterized protein LOC127843245 [Dreissena polymorpha]KAH3785584.1 hypothetical protein DPMN_163677 [Dreissena polymorpha]